MVSEVSLKKYIAMGIYPPKKSRRGGKPCYKEDQKVKIPLFKKFFSKAYSLIEFLSVITRSVFLRKIRRRRSCLPCRIVNPTHGFLVGAPWAERQERSLPPHRQRTKAALVLLSTMAPIQ